MPHLASVDLVPIFIGFTLTVVAGIVGWLIGISFKAGAQNEKIEQHGADIAAIIKKMETMQTSLNSAHSKAQNANATADAAHAMVKEAVTQLGKVQDDMKDVVEAFYNKVDSVKDRLTELTNKK